MTGNWVPRGNDTQRLQGQLAALIAQLQASANAALALKNTMAQMTTGNDHTTIENQFGVSVSNGQTLQSVLGTASDTLQSPAIQDLLQRFA